MDNKEIRYRNLQILIREAGSQAELAKICNISVGYLGQLNIKAIAHSGKSPRGPGKELAAKLELGMGKEKGWMDNLHEEIDEKQTKSKKVNVISWDSIPDWENINISVDQTPFIPGYSDKTFAVIAQEKSMITVFPIGCTVYVDPDIQAKPNEHHVLALIDKQPTIRALILDGGKLYLKSEADGFANILVDDNVIIIGKIVFWYNAADGQKLPLYQ